jgi:hypothetical protein
LGASSSSSEEEKKSEEVGALSLSLLLSNQHFLFWACSPSLKGKPITRLLRGSSSPAPAARRTSREVGDVGEKGKGEIRNRVATERSLFEK